MNEVTRMTVPPPLLTMKSQGTRESNQTVSIRTISPPSSSTSSSSTNLTTTSEAVGATVFVGASAPAADSMATTCRTTRIPEVQTANGYGQHQKNNAVQQSYQQSQQRQQASHVVKIKIDPDGEKKGMVISTVRLTLNDNNPNITDHDNKIIEQRNGLLDVVDDGENNDVNKVVNVTKNFVNERRSATGVRISVFSGDHDYAVVKNNNNNNNDTCKDGENMVQQITNSETTTTTTTATVPISNTTGNNNNNDGTKSCFYYHNFQIPLVMSSGQCSPSETLDSGTCSDLDGTPPPLPKKKNVNKRNSSTVILSGINADDNNQHNRTNSSTSSGPEVEDSDDNESNISGDSLNGIDVEDPVTSGRITAVTLQKDNGNHGHSLKQSASASAGASGTGAIGTGSSLETNSKIDELSKQSKVVVDIQENVSTKLGQNELTNGDGNDDDDDVNDQERRHDIPINGTSASNSVRVSPCTSPSPSVRTNSSTGSSSYVSKASSTPRIRSPELDGKFHSFSSSSSSPVVRECTYEERKQEQKRLEEEILRLNQLTEDEKHMAGDKYVYDRFLKFHVNGLKSDNKEDSVTKDDEGGSRGEIDESFAGCKILEKEAIRSAKGTVRGVKNRVRAGIATFLQKPSAKTYREEAGKLVVYTTSLGVVRETYYRCIKVKQILRTNMARFDEKDLLYRSELKSELKDRIGDASMHLPQIFVDGQYLGDGERIEELNESGQLRDILQPYITDYRQLGQCTKCGDYRMLLCTTCNGSKRSHYRNEFTKEIVALRCMKCNEAGLIVCDSC